MPYTKKICTLLVFQLFFLRVIALPAGEIRGNVIDSLQIPIESVSVKLLKLPDSVLISNISTNKEGFFKFSNVPLGNYILMADMVGYRKVIRRISVGSVKPPIAVQIVMLKDNKLLQEVLVNGNSEYINSSPGRTTLNIDKSITATGSSAFDVLRRAPGVVLDIGGISMRGRQGVTVMIDGKALSLSTSDVVELLRNTSTESIDKIELISNPSSSYDASGGAGIINLKLKKSKSRGTNGSVTLGGGYGENYKLNTSLLLNRRENSFNIYGSLNLSDNKRADRYFMDRGVSYGSRNIGFNIDNYDLKTLANVGFKGGIDYFLKKDQVIGFMYTGMYNHMFSDEDNHTFISTSGVRDSTIFTYSDERRNISNNAFNLNYTATLKSKVAVALDLDYLTYHRRSNEDLSYVFYNSRNELYKDTQGLTSLTPSDITIQSAKVDVTKTFPDRSVFLAGVKASLVSNNNSRLIENKTQDSWLYESFVNDESRFREQIQAVYGSYKKQYRKADFELGLRGELTRSSGTSYRNSPSDRDYFNLFPSLNVSYAADSIHKLGFQYSRRINRPAYDDLNPFRYFLDQYTYREGNPFLRPEYSTTVELSDTYKGKLTAALSYNSVKDYYLTFTDQDQNTGISRSIKRNLRGYRSVGLEFSYMLVVSQWLNSNLNAEGYLRKFNIGENDDMVRNSSYYSLSSANTVKLRNGISAQCTFNYESPTISGMYNFKSLYILDVGAGKSFPKKNISLRVSVSDILNSDRSRYSSDLSNASLLGKQKSETRVFRMNITYKFGGKNTISPGRKTGNDMESRRVSY